MDLQKTSNNCLSSTLCHEVAGLNLLVRHPEPCFWCLVSMKIWSKKTHKQKESRTESVVDMRDMRKVAFFAEAGINIITNS